ncbi:dTMP kinase [Dietzia sp.]|uniref:dTMP kinase n=1 Tax=Dietzia sp. TaxID=1871616 RepID=UPI002FD8882E
MGLLVAIEGIDGAGKNTLATALEKELSARGLRSLRLAFPRYGTRLADVASAALHSEKGFLAGSPEAMALLFALDRADALVEIAKLRALSDVLICDRFVASNAAYSAARLGEDRFADVAEWIELMEHESLGIPRPDAYFLLPTDVAEAHRRADLRAKESEERRLDSYETDADLQAATARSYERLAAENWVAPWFRAGDPTSTPEESAAVLAENIVSLA